MKTITVQRAITSITFGIFVTTATISRADGIPMDWYDLDHFQIDCSIKQEQIEFLNSIRHSETDMIGARLMELVTPWNKVIRPTDAKRVHRTGNGDYNWLINQHLYTLSTQC